MTRKSQRIGSQGQNQAIATLQRLGFLTVQEIATPVIFKDRTIIAWKHKVSGDHTAILAGGLFVLCETKTVTSGNLSYSELKEHQRQNLTNHAKAGGLSLLIWVSEFGTYVMEWGMDGIDGYMQPRTSIKQEQADLLHNELTDKLIRYEVRIERNPVSVWDGRDLDLNWIKLNL